MDVIERRRRAQTIGHLLHNVLAVLVASIALLMVLRELGVDIMPMLTGAGIVGVALGFGSQYLVRDVIAGFFLILENQVRVGDAAVVNGTGGTVESVNLRTITLRDAEGTVHVFQNGAIATLANRSKDYAYYVIDVNVLYEQDTDQVVAVLRKVGTELGGRSGVQGPDPGAARSPRRGRLPRHEGDHQDSDQDAAAQAVGGRAGTAPPHHDRPRTEQHCPATARRSRFTCDRPKKELANDECRLTNDDWPSGAVTIDEGRLTNDD